MTRVGFRPVASSDLEAAHAWYEQQRPGLGDEFVAAVEMGIASIVAFPEAHRVVHRGARRFLVERFPYALYYRVVDRQVTIVACLHSARNPEEWHSRLEG